MKTYEYDKEFYVKFRKLVVDFMSFLYKIEATGVDNIPKDTNYLLVGNHLHIMDAGLIAKYDDSYLRFLVNNKLYMLRFNKGELEKKESLYAHFQHRPFMKDKVTDYSHFLVTPNAIIDYPRCFVNLRLRWLCRNRSLMTKYYQWKDLLIWKLGLSKNK